MAKILNDPRDWTGCTTIDTKTHRALRAVARAAAKIADAWDRGYGPSRFELDALLKATQRLDKLKGKGRKVVA